MARWPVKKDALNASSSKTKPKAKPKAAAVAANVAAKIKKILKVKVKKEDCGKKGKKGAATAVMEAANVPARRGRPPKGLEDTAKLGQAKRHEQYTDFIRLVNLFPEVHYSHLHRILLLCQGVLVRAIDNVLRAREVHYRQERLTDTLEAKEKFFQKYHAQEQTRRASTLTGGFMVNQEAVKPVVNVQQQQPAEGGTPTASSMAIIQDQVKTQALYIFKKLAMQQASGIKTVQVKNETSAEVGSGRGPQPPGGEPIRVHVTGEGTGEDTGASVPPPNPLESVLKPFLRPQTLTDASKQLGVDFYKQQAYWKGRHGRTDDRGILRNPLLTDKKKEELKPAVKTVLFNMDEHDTGSLEALADAAMVHAQVSDEESTVECDQQTKSKPEYQFPVKVAAVNQVEALPEMKFEHGTALSALDESVIFDVRPNHISFNAKDLDVQYPLLNTPTGNHNDVEMYEPMHYERYKDTSEAYEADDSHFLQLSSDGNETENSMRLIIDPDFAEDLNNTDPDWMQDNIGTSV